MKDNADSLVCVLSLPAGYCVIVEMKNRETHIALLMLDIYNPYKKCCAVELKCIDQLCLSVPIKTKNKYHGIHSFIPYLCVIMHVGDICLYLTHRP